jgi:hypothetical protein
MERSYGPACSPTRLPHAHAHGERHHEAKKLDGIRDNPMAAPDDPNSPMFYHGAKADLKPGDLIECGMSKLSGGD